MKKVNKKRSTPNREKIMEYRGMENDESQSCWHLGKSWARIYMWMEWLHYVFILDKQAVVHKDLDLMEDV